MNRRASAVVASLLIALSSSAACAQESETGEFSGKPFWEVLIGPFAIHWSNNPEHKHVYLLGIERAQADGYIWGFSAFSNSFGQPSAYAYYGYRWDDLFGYPKVYAKLTGGIIYGYKYPYENKIPFNHDGVGLGVIPAIGYRFTPRDAVQVEMLGTAGLMFTYNRRF